MDYIPPPQPVVPVTSECVVAAANQYQVPPALILSILKVEGGKVGEISKNTNGTVDIGPMQINSIHLPSFAKYGITYDRLKNDGCLNVHIGTYLIKKAEVEKTGGAKNVDPATFWKAVGNYHSKTPDKNYNYANKVAKAASTLPPAWKNFDCKKYNVCSLTINSKEVSPQTSHSFTAQKPSPANIQVSDSQPSFQALSPYTGKK